MHDLKIRVEGPKTAPWLVLSNSLGTTADMWEPQISPLRSRFRVVRYEHRGHGGTVAPAGPYGIEDLGSDLVDVLDAVGADRANLLGLSLGGTVAMWLAASHPERVERLVIAASKAYWPPSHAWQDRADLVLREGTIGLLDALMARWFTEPFAAGRADLRSTVAAMLSAADPEGYAGCCGVLGALDLRRHLSAIEATTLVLVGGADPVVSIGDAVDVAEAIPGSSLQMISPAAHLINLEQPERFTAAVIDHLAGDVAERGRRTRREVLGDAHVDRAESSLTAMSAPFSDLITRYAWGEIWTRPGLDRRTRSLVTVAMLVALGRLDELELHLVAARRNGLSDDEISEVLLQAAIYAGVPAANTAFAVARRVLGAGDGGSLGVGLPERGT